MKTLTTLAVLLIGVLTLAAFNPKEVVRTVKKAKMKLVVEPRNAAEMENLLEKAENGDPEAQFQVGSIISRPNWYVKPGAAQILEGFDPAEGEAMIRSAASKGQPDARFWVWKKNGGPDSELPGLIADGSVFARMAVLSRYYDDPCDASTDRMMDEIQRQLKDPSSNAYRYVTGDKAAIAAEAAKSFDSERKNIETYRIDACAPGNP